MTLELMTQTDSLQGWAWLLVDSGCPVPNLQPSAHLRVEPEDRSPQRPHSSGGKGPQANGVCRGGGMEKRVRCGESRPQHRSMSPRAAVHSGSHAQHRHQAA